MRLTTAVIIAAAAACVLVAIPVPARAQQNAPTPGECAAAYKQAQTERGHFNLSRNDPKWKSYDSVLSYIEHGTDIDFNDRYDQMKKKFPQDFDVQSAFVAGANLSEDIRYQGFLAKADTLLQPDKVFSVTIPIMTRVRACDQIHGFTPVLGAADLKFIVGKLQAALDREKAQKEERLAKLDDLACAARFLIVASSTTGDAQQEWQRRTLSLLPKVQAAMPGMPQERIGVELQRRAEEVGAKYNNEEGGKMLMEEINRCETNNGLPATPAQ